MKPFLLAFWLIPVFALAGTNYWTLDQCSRHEAFSKDTISLTIDGKKVLITEFHRIDGRPPPNSHPSMFRNLVLVVDLESQTAEQFQSAKNTVATILKKAGKFDLISIATISRKGLRYLSMFNADHSGSLESLNTIANEDPSDQKGDVRVGLVEGLGQLAMHLSIIQGPKQVVLFSPGFKTEGLRSGGVSDQEEPELVMGEVSEEERLKWQKDRADKKATGPRVDVSKLQELFAGSGTQVSIVGGIENNLYRDLAEKTGGVLLKENLELNLDQVISSASDFCVIGWQGEFEQEFKRTHKLKIENESKVVHESFWIAPRSLQSLTSEERKLKAAEAVYKNQDSGPFEYLADSIFYEGENGIPVFVQMPGTHILKTKNPEALMEFYGFAFSSEGRILDSFMVPMKLDLKNKKLKEKIQRAGVKLWNVLYAGAGVINVHWVLLDLTSDQVVTHRETLELHSDSLSVSLPFFPDINLDWVLWPAPTTVSDRNGKQIRYPYSAGSDYFSPDLDPVIGVRDGGIVYMRIYNKDPESKNPPIAFKLTDVSGQTSSIEQFQLLQKPLVLEKNGLELFWKINSFPQLKPGSGRLQVEIRDLRSGQTIKRQTLLRLL